MDIFIERAQYCCGLLTDVAQALAYEWEAVVRNKYASACATSKIKKMSLNFQNHNAWENKNQYVDYEASVTFLSFYANDLIQRANLEQFKEAPSVRLLDVATGTGLVAFKLEELLSNYKNVTIDGVDFSSTMIQAANEKKKQRNSQMTVFQEMDGQDLKFQDETFQVVFANMGVLFYPDIVKGLKEMHRVLQSGGHAFVNAWTRDLPARVPLELALELSGKDFSKSPALSLSDPKVFSQFAQQAGFSKVSVETVRFVARVKFTSYIESLKVNPALFPENEEEFIAKIAEKFGVVDYNQEIEIETAANVASLTK